LPGTGQTQLAQTVLAQLGGGLLIGSLGQGGAVDRCLSARPLPFLGKISYGVYLWHFPIVMMMGGARWYVLLPAVLSGAVLMATLSYYVVESKARRLRIIAFVRRTVSPAGPADRVVSVRRER
jgi:peptidoglycan/LPS O-acetylase OafA/YrhL